LLPSPSHRFSPPSPPHKHSTNTHTRRTRWTRSNTTRLRWTKALRTRVSGYPGVQRVHGRYQETDRKEERKKSVRRKGEKRHTWCLVLGWMTHPPHGVRVVVTMRLPAARSIRHTSVTGGPDSRDEVAKGANEARIATEPQKQAHSTKEEQQKREESCRYRKRRGPGRCGEGPHFSEVGRSRFLAERPQLVLKPQFVHIWALALRCLGRHQ